MPLLAFDKGGELRPDFDSPSPAELKARQRSCLFPPETPPRSRFTYSKKAYQGEEEIRRHATLFRQRVNEENLPLLAALLLEHRDSGINFFR